MIAGRSNGAGTFAAGELKLTGDVYRLTGTRSDGVRFGTRVTDVVYEGKQLSPGTSSQVNCLDLTGHDFRLSKDRLDLRRASDYDSEEET